MAKQRSKACRHAKTRRTPKARPQGILELTQAGYGFVKTAEGEFFIPASKVRDAFPGDLVEVAKLSSNEQSRGDYAMSHRPAARVVRVVMRGTETLIGRYEVAEPFGVVVPEDASIKHDIFTLRKNAPEVNDGDIVEVRILEFPSRNSAATGEVVRVLGHEDDVDIAIDLIVADHKFETEFSDEVLAEADQCSINVEQALLDGYRDLRQEFIFTVDPQDARDFDDAVSIEKVEGGWNLGVHIADVSAFVPFNSAMDMAARRRATSVYLVDRVIPMLPEALSNSLCSLVPGTPRLAVSVLAKMRTDGSVVEYEVVPSVIQSKARLSYDQAQALIDAEMPDEGIGEMNRCEVPQGALPLSAEVQETLYEKVNHLNSLAETLLHHRQNKGCLEFDRVEAKAQLDADGHPVKINYRRRTQATQAIEEAMILANSLVAEWLTARELPCVYRTHGVPDGNSLRSLYEILQEYTLFKQVDKRLFCDGNPATLQRVLQRTEGLPQKELVHTLMLRAMKRAVYSTENEGHFGLALDTYCHFTSPIRRYPDLLVHRMCKEAFFGHTATYEAQKNSLAWMAEHSSKMEREAEAAARESQLVKIIEYLESYIGHTFSGVVSSVSTFGLQVRLECTASGLVPLDSLGNEYFSFDPARYVLTGADTGVTYRLGQRVQVVLREAHPRERRLLLQLANKRR